MVVKKASLILFMILSVSCGLVGKEQNEAEHLIAQSVRDLIINSPLLLAVEAGDLEEVKRLINAGANINEVSGEGTPLMYSVLYYKKEVLKWLIEAGANVNQTNSNGSTTLMLAASLKNHHAATTLIHAGADLLVKDVDGNDALEYALLYGCNTFAKKLVLEIIKQHPELSQEMRQRCDTLSQNKVSAAVRRTLWFMGAVVGGAVVMTSALYAMCCYKSAGAPHGAGVFIIPHVDVPREPAVAGPSVKERPNKNLLNNELVVITAECS